MDEKSHQERDIFDSHNKTLKIQRCLMILHIWFCKYVDDVLLETFYLYVKVWSPEPSCGWSLLRTSGHLDIKTNTPKFPFIQQVWSESSEMFRILLQNRSQIKSMPLLSLVIGTSPQPTDSGFIHYFLQYYVLFINCALHL